MRFGVVLFRSCGEVDVGEVGQRNLDFDRHVAIEITHDRRKVVNSNT